MDGEPKMQRLAAAADRIAVLHEELGAEQARRDELIVALRDEGMSWRPLARAARLSMSRCVAIVAGEP